MENKKQVSEKSLAKKKMIEERRISEQGMKEIGVSFEWRLIKKDGTHKRATAKNKKAILVTVFL